MGNRKLPSPPPGDPDYVGPPQVKPLPPPAPPVKRYRGCGIIVLLGLFAALGCAEVSAQTVHECDKTVTPNVTVQHATITVGFCSDLKDTDKKPVTVTAFEISVDGSVTTWANPTPVTPTANSQGQLYFEAPAIAAAPGTHSVSVTAVAATRKSLPSTVYAFSSILPPPSIVIGVRAR